MLRGKFIKLSAVVVFIVSVIIISTVLVLADKMRPELDVPYEPTHPSVVESMLRVANTSKGDVVYDLGCGDGRIVVMAVQKFNAARAVGIDIDPQRLGEAKERSKQMGVENKTRYIQGNIMEVDISPANIVTMYLLDSINLMVRPKLFMELKPGTRCVAHAFHMSDWKADKIVQHPKARNKKISYWVIPASLGGTWTWKTNTPNGESAGSLTLSQTFQVVDGSLKLGGGANVRITNPLVDGKNFSFSAHNIKYSGVAEGDTIRGTQEWSGGSKYVWVAKREPVKVFGSWDVNINSANVRLNGVLTLKHKSSTKLLASYFIQGEGREENIRDVYVWGNSVYFRVPMYGRENVAIFKGVLDNDKGSGKVSSETWGSEYSWTAKRTK